MTDLNTLGHQIKKHIDAAAVHDGKAAEHRLLAGRKLIAAKAALGCGKFGPWVKNTVGISGPKASKLMRWVKDPAGAELYARVNQARKVYRRRLATAALHEKEAAAQAAPPLVGPSRRQRLLDKLTATAEHLELSEKELARVIDRMWSMRPGMRR